METRGQGSAKLRFIAHLQPCRMTQCSSSCRSSKYQKCVCWGFYVLATSTVILGRVATYNSARLLLYSAAPMGDQAVSTMIRVATQSHEPDTELTSHYTTLIMPSTSVVTGKHQFLLLIGLPQQEFEIQTFSVGPGAIGAESVEHVGDREFSSRLRQTSDL